MTTLDLKIVAIFRLDQGGVCFKFIFYCKKNAIAYRTSLLKDVYSKALGDTMHNYI
jgi:hypothetical protein